jgi:hypothetical protein
MYERAKRYFDLGGDSNHKLDKKIGLIKNS